MFKLYYIKFIFLLLLFITYSNCETKPVKPEIDKKEEKIDVISNVDNVQTNILKPAQKTNIIIESVSVDLVLEEDFNKKLSKNFNFTNLNKIRIYSLPSILPGGKIKSVYIKYENEEWKNMIENNGIYYYDFDNLKQGTNIFWSYAVEVNGYSSLTDVIGVFVDNEGPNIEIKNPTNNQMFVIDRLPYTINIEGKIVDNLSSLKNIYFYISSKNKTNYYEGIIKENQFIGKVIVNSLGKYEIWVEAIDILENRGKTDSLSIYITSLPGITIE